MKRECLMFSSFFDSMLATVEQPLPVCPVSPIIMKSSLSPYILETASVKYSFIEILVLGGFLSISAG